MKWITHQCVGLGCAAALGLPLPALAGVAAGTILPDVLDQGMARVLIFRQAAFNRIHRGATHWFGWWLGLMLPVLAGGTAASVLPFDALLLHGLGFGGLSHVLLDMATVYGVPVAPWSKKRRIAFKLCATGSLREYLFLAAFVAAMVFLFGERLLAPFRNVRSLMQ